MKKSETQPDHHVRAWIKKHIIGDETNRDYVRASGQSSSQSPEVPDVPDIPAQDASTLDILSDFALGTALSLGTGIVVEVLRHLIEIDQTNTETTDQISKTDT